MHRFSAAVLAAASLATAPASAAAQAVSLVSPDGDIDWNRFYTAAETNQILRELHAIYPDLTELDQVGESYYGQPLMLITITNEATGPAADKPALYVDGGHSRGRAHRLGRAHPLHRTPPERLRQRRARHGPARRACILRAAEVQPGRLRSGAHRGPVPAQHAAPVRRGRRTASSDEDPPEDLDGDGWITQLRYPDDDGIWVLDPDDDRILVRGPRAADVRAALLDRARGGRQRR